MTPLLLRGASSLLTLDPEQGPGPLGEIANAAVLIEDGRIAALGPAEAVIPEEIPGHWRVLDCAGGLLMPGLADCHTHSVFAGNRAGEWRRRLSGERYEDILASGGGIHSTVRATRDASEAELEALLEERLERGLRRGITAVEVKSGYGLSHEHELRLLRVVRRVAERWPGRVSATYLGAHTVPRDHHGGRSGYLHEMRSRTLPRVVDEGLAEACDVYCDSGAYTLDEARMVLERAAELGLALRIHAEQITHTGAAALAASLGARSADHLERVDEAGMRAMAAAGTIAVLLPGARFFLRDDPPPARALADAGVPLAVATDFNPGTSPTADLLLCALMACQDMGLTVEEAVAGITRTPRRVLGLDEGLIRVGAGADLALFDQAGPAELLQYATEARCLAVVAGDRLFDWTSPPPVT